MTKLIKISLISAVLATSGFASDEIAKLENGGEIEASATINLENQTITLNENKSLDVYGSLTGTGTINCSGTGKVNVYGTQYKEDEDNQAAILGALSKTGLTVHTLDESNSGSISETIAVEPSTSLNKTEADLARYAAGQGAADLVYVANSTGSATNCIGSTETTATEISAALANPTVAIEGFEPSGLVMTNKLTFSGDNSGFTQKTVEIGTTETSAEVEYANANSIFPVVTTVEEGSKLTISDTNGVNLANNLTVNGSKKVLKADPSVVLDNSQGTLVVKGKLVVKSGTTLTLGTNCEKVNADCTYNYPTVMTWPKDTFENTLTTSDGNDGWSEGTVHDTVFSYTGGTDDSYTRTHQYKWSDNWARFDIGTKTTGTLDYRGGLGFTLMRTVNNINLVSPEGTYDIAVQGNSTTGIYYTTNYRATQEFAESVNSSGAANYSTLDSINENAIVITGTDDLE